MKYIYKITCHDGQHLADSLARKMINALIDKKVGLELYGNKQINIVINKEIDIAVWHQKFESYLLKKHPELSSFKYSDRLINLTRQ